MKNVWILALLALVPAGTTTRAETAQGFESDEFFVRVERTEFTPLYGQVTDEITSNMSDQVGTMELRGPGFIALPTVGANCLTTAPNCGRPTFGCNLKPTTGRKCRPTFQCNQTTAITCGCKPTQGNCQPPPPRTTAPNCGMPPTTAPNCGVPQPQPGPGPMTTAPNCR